MCCSDASPGNFVTRVILQNGGTAIQSRHCLSKGISLSLVSFDNLIPVVLGRFESPPLLTRSLASRMLARMSRKACLTVLTKISGGPQHKLCP